MGEDLHGPAVGRKEGRKGGKALNRNPVRDRMIEPRARTLKSPWLVRSDTFFFFFCLDLGFRWLVSAMVRPPNPRKRGNIGRLRARFDFSSCCSRNRLALEIIS